MQDGLKPFFFVISNIEENNTMFSKHSVLDKVGALTMDLDLGIISESEKRLKKKLILDYLYANLKHHNFWASRYFFCELLALVNVTG